MMLLRVITFLGVLILVKTGTNKTSLKKISIKLNLNIKYDSKNSSGSFDNSLTEENNEAKNISHRGRALTTSVEPVYTKVCEKCKCDGEEGIHYEKLRQPAETVNECFKLAASNPFCGDMIVRDDSTTCYCRRIGESDTCTQIETYANWAVYKAFSICKGWKQTAGCHPNGAREPIYDKNCSEPITSALSGFCDCGTKIVEKYCYAWSYRDCNHACSSLGSANMNDISSGSGRNFYSSYAYDILSRMSRSKNRRRKCKGRRRCRSG